MPQSNKIKLTEEYYNMWQGKVFHLSSIHSKILSSCILTLEVVVIKRRRRNSIEYVQNSQDQNCKRHVKQDNISISSSSVLCDFPISIGVEVYTNVALLDKLAEWKRPYIVMKFISLPENSPYINVPMS